MSRPVSLPPRWTRLIACSFCNLLCVRDMRLVRSSPLYSFCTGDRPWMSTIMIGSIILPPLFCLHSPTCPGAPLHLHFTGHCSPRIHLIHLAPLSITHYNYARRVNFHFWCSGKTTADIERQKSGNSRTVRPVYIEFFWNPEKEYEVGDQTDQG